MKKLLLLFFLLSFIKMEAQQLRGIEKSDIRRGFFVALSGGLTSPTGDYKTYADKRTNADGQVIFGATEKITGTSQFNLDAGYRFGAFGLGVSIGSFKHKLDGLSFLSDLFNADFPILKNGGAIDGTYYGAGPDYTFSFGKFSTTTSARVGLMNFSTNTFTGSYNGSDTAVPIEVIKTDIASDGNTSLAYSSFGLKLSYDITKQLSLFTKTDYFIALGDGLKVKDNGIVLNDINKDQLITVADFDFAAEPSRFEKVRTIKPKMINVGFGLTYNFNKKKSEASSSLKDQQQKGNKKIEAGQITKILKRKDLKNEIKDAEDVNSSSKMPPRDIDKPNLIQKENPSINNTKSQKGIIAILPANNTHFKSVDEIENFTWKLLGDKIPNPNYIIEITKIGSNRQPQRVYIGTSPNTQIVAKKVAKFKAGKALADTVKRTDNSGGGNEEQAGEGQYSWKVTETSTGMSSNTLFFSISSCDVDLQITNESIECLGYEGENRKFKICFSSTYQSSTGDLTFSPGSGLSVFDQNSVALSYTLVSPNPTLLTQIGASTTTVNYCFEVLVNSSVTSIGFGIQGDDLDPTTIVCQPGASLNIDTLPNCLCDSCDAVQTDISNFTATAQNNSINLSGSLTANVPIYGIEVQVVSYSYNAQPSACSAGVASLEQSGMILLGQSSINNSTQLQAYNLIGTPNNTNATKAVKYMSSGPMNGSIPISLDMGLPMPLAGLDSGCCNINYKVCIRIRLYSERGVCASCVFDYCVDFTN